MIAVKYMFVKGVGIYKIYSPYPFIIVFPAEAFLFAKSIIKMI